METLFSDDLMDVFYERNHKELLAHTTRAFAKIVDEMRSGGKRVLSVGGWSGYVYAISLVQ